MIPLKLKLTNFMSYHAAEVDLAGIHLACLCGENGAGKSSLLAAMTWALWGKARDKVGDDELIASGMMEMSVDFEFALGDQTYRALRQRSKAKGGESHLYFQVCDPLSGIWQNIGEANIRGSQRKIDETLRMDYETFINSAFLMQGRADEFARKAPGERKKVLGEILGLSYYDQLEAKAKEERTRAEMHLREIDTTLRLLDQQLADKPEQVRRLEQASGRLHDLNQQYDAQREVTDALSARYHRLEQRYEELQQIDQRIAQATAEREQAEIALRRAQEEMARATALLAERDPVQRGYDELLTVRADLDLYATKLTTCWQNLFPAAGSVAAAYWLRSLLYP